MTIRGGPDIIEDGLVLHLDAADKNSYPGTGSTWYDLSGQDNHVTKDATYSPSFNSNGYFTFNGGQNFETQSANTSIGSEITIICWYMQTGTGAGAPRLIETHINNSVISNGNAICVDTDYSIRAWFDYSGSGSARRESRDSVSGLTANTWRMAAYTYNGTSGSSKIYINGQDISATLVTSNVSSPDIDDINIITIGAISDYNTYSHNQHYFTGRISTCKIYNKGLTQAEITQNYNALKGRYGL